MYDIVKYDFRITTNTLADPVRGVPGDRHRTARRPRRARDARPRRSRPGRDLDTRSFGNLTARVPESPRTVRSMVGSARRRARAYGGRVRRGVHRRVARARGWRGTDIRLASPESVRARRVSGRARPRRGPAGTRPLVRPTRGRHAHDRRRRRRHALLGGVRGARTSPRSHRGPASFADRVGPQPPARAADPRSRRCIPGQPGRRTRRHRVAVSLRAARDRRPPGRRPPRALHPWSAAHARRLATGARRVPLPLHGGPRAVRRRRVRHGLQRAEHRARARVRRGPPAARARFESCDPAVCSASTHRTGRCAGCTRARR